MSEKVLSLIPKITEFVRWRCLLGWARFSVKPLPLFLSLSSVHGDFNAQGEGISNRVSSFMGEGGICFATVLLQPNFTNGLIFRFL